MKKADWIRLLVMTVVLILMASPALAGQGANVTFGIDSAKAKVGELYLDTYGGEHVAVVYDGQNQTVYAAFADWDFSNNTKVVLASSDDGGQTWGFSLVLGHDDSINWNGVALATTQSTPHVIWAQYDDTLGRYVLMYNKGIRPIGNYQYLNYAVNISGTSHSVNGQATSIAGAGSYVHIAYTASSPSKGIYYIKSIDDGDTFSSPEAVNTGTYYNPRELSIAADTSGNVFLAAETYSGNLIFTKKHSGQTWATPVEISGSYAEAAPSIVVADSSNIHVAWSNWSGTGIVVASTSDGGLSWTQQVVGSVSYDQTDLAIHPNGDLSVMGLASTGDLHMYQTTNSLTSWTNAIDVMSDASYPSIEIDPQGLAHVVASNQNGDTVYYTKQK